MTAIAPTVVKVGPEFLVDTLTAGNQSVPVIAKLQNGGFVVAWQDNGGALGDTGGSAVAAQVFDAAGHKVGDEFRVNTSTANDQLRPSVTGLSGGGFVVTWSDNSGVGDTSGYGIKAQIYGADRTPVGSEFLVNTQTAGSQTLPTIAALSGGGFVVTWTDPSNKPTGSAGDASGTGVKGQVYGATGNKVGAEFLVKTITRGDQDHPSVTGLSDGRFVVAWQDYSNTSPETDGSAGIRAQIFDATGGKSGAEFLVNTRTANMQRNPTVTALAGGGFVVAWDDNIDGQYDIKAQIYDAAGAKVGGEFLVNTVTTAAQYYPSIAALADGGFVVTWSDETSGAYGDTYAGINAQVFDAAGNKVGSEFLANTLTSGPQYYPSVTGLANGSFVVTWQDFSHGLGDAEAYAVAAQVFDVPAVVTAVTASPASGTEHVGDTVAFTLTMSKAVTVTGGVPTLALGNGGTAVYDPSLGDATHLVFTYTVGAADLPATALSIVGGQTNGASIGDPAGQGPDFSGIFTRFPALQVSTPATAVVSIETSQALAHAGDTITLTMTMSRAVSVTGGAPTLALDDGGTATYDAAATAALGDPTKLVFKYTVTASDDAVDRLAVVGAAANGAHIADLADQFPDFSGIFAALPAIRIDTPPTAVVSFVASSPREAVQLGDVVTLTATLSRPVSVTGGTPTLALDDGGTAIYDAAATAALGDPTKLVFTYTVGASDHTVPVLAVVGGSLGGARLVDAAGHDPDYAGFFASFPDVAVIVPPAAQPATPLGPEFLVNTTTASTQVVAATAPLAGGGFVVTWQDYSGSTPDIRAQIYGAGGAKVGTEFRVNSHVADTQSNPAVTGLADGGFVVTWTDQDWTSDGSGSCVKAQRYDRAGVAVGTEVVVNTNTTGAQQYPSVAALAGGGWVVTWQDGFIGDVGVKAQLFDAAGARVGTEVLVNAASTDWMYAPKVTALADGGFVVTWFDESLADYKDRPRAQLFDAAGHKVGDEIAVAADGTWSGSTPKLSVTGLATGGFVVAWDSTANGGDITAQRFDAAGHAVGGAFTVNTTTAGNQAAANVTALAGGGFVVTWGDNAVGSGDIKGQQFDADGHRVGTEFTVSSTTAGAQLYPTVAGLDNGDFAVAWQTTDGIPGVTAFNIAARVFDAGPTVTTVAAGTHVAVDASATVNVAFAPGGGTLELDHHPLQQVIGQVVGFGHGDVIDLTEVAFSNTGMSVAFEAYDSATGVTGGILTVKDDVYVGRLSLLGQYTAGSFALAADGHGGTLVTVGPQDPQNAPYAPTQGA